MNMNFKSKKKVLNINSSVSKNLIMYSIIQNDYFFGNYVIGGLQFHKTPFERNFTSNV